MQLTDVYQTANAPEILYRLLQERSTDSDGFVNISHRKLPSWDEHIAFIERRFYRHWWLLYYDGEYVGSGTISFANEIGIVLFKKFRGRGLGYAFMREMMDSVEPLPAIPSERVGYWISHVNPKNSRSIHMVEKLGGRLEQLTFAYPSSPDDLQVNQSAAD